MSVELEPLDLVNGSNLTWVLMDAGRLDEAVANGRKLQELEPGFTLGTYQMGLAYDAKGMYEEAITLAEAALQREPNNQKMLQVAGYAYAKSGRPGEARAAIARLKELSKTEYVISYFVATIYAALGENDAAFGELKKAEDERDWRMITHIKNDFMISPLRNDPRFTEILRRMKLPE